MMSNSWPLKSNKSSIEGWHIPTEVQSFDPDKIYLKENVQPHSSSPTKSSVTSEITFSSKRLSTAQLVSAVGDIWGCIGQPAVFNTKENLKYDDFFGKKNIIFPSNIQSTHGATASSENEYLCYGLESGSCFSQEAKSDFDSLKTTKKMLLFGSCNINTAFIWRQIQVNNYHSHVDTSGIDKTSSIGVCSKVATTCGTLMWKSFFGLSNLVKSKSISANQISNSGKVSFDDLSSTRSSGRNATTEAEGFSPVESVKLVDNVQDSPESFYSTSSLNPVAATEEPSGVLRSLSSDVHLDGNVELLTSIPCNFKQCSQSTDSCCILGESSAEMSATEKHTIHENVKKLFHKHDLEEESTQLQWLLIQDKLQYAFAQNRHALAGALAGTLVSLCLHPIDTVKTVIQSSRMSQKSFYHVSRTIISERGLMGLYRGVASNIASSAPISAIYTFTYESVKGALLPLLPKEYHSLAHCAAGGCSSIATSFIFTPSECIKQQMQVNSQYQNCWNALIGCLEKGGVASLYAGWGAVLCRNIPHSIIKFYTYERLKQLLLSVRPDTSLSTLQTLICGGMAGSTAALFTTPFDVVKTRLQTQAAGSLGKCDGVFHVLQDIAQNEGLQGLYRGLSPRLAMYMSQGAIFFASYEFLKAVFSSNIPETAIQVIKDKQKT